MTLPSSTWNILKQSADRARGRVAHDEAIDLYTQALAKPNVPWESMAAMTLARADSREMLGDTARMDAELTQLAEQAQQRGDLATRVTALARLAEVLRYLGDAERSKQLGELAVQSANQSGDLRLRETALSVLGQAITFRGEYDQAETVLDHMQAIAEPDDAIQQMFIYRLQASIFYRCQNDFPKARRSAEQGLQLARASGSRLQEAHFLSLLANVSSDQTQRGLYLDQALTTFQTLGSRMYENMVLMNYCIWWYQIGLFHREEETAQQALVAGRAMNVEYDVLYALQFLSGALGELGEFQEAEVSLSEAMQIANKYNDVLMIGNLVTIQALCALYQGAGNKAMALLEGVDEKSEKFSPLLKATIMAYQAVACRLVRDDLSARSRANDLARQALALINPEIFGTAEALPEEIIWWCYRALSQNFMATESEPEINDEQWQALDLGRQAVLIPMGNISDAGLRRGYLHRVRIRRLTVREWLRYAAAHGVSDDQLAEFTAQVERPGRLDEVFQRLIGVGVLLNAQRDTASLPDDIVQEVSELTGAERIALVLFDKEGSRRSVKTLLPLPAFPTMSGTVETPPDEKAFLAEIEPWLDEGAATRQGFIHRVNPESSLLEQRSILVAPLLIQGRLIGLIYTDLTGCFGRFEREDLDLLGVLANQSAVAVENADWSATLEKRVNERTAELIQSNTRLEQRNAELAIINGIQQGLASRLDFQAIVDLVGDKLRNVFNTPDLFITWIDEETNLIHYLYTFEHGERITVPPRLPNPGGIYEREAKTRQPVVWNTLEEGDKISQTLPGTDASKSGVAVPVISSDRIIGSIQLENYERENAYGESELRLLTTIAASLGAALDNAHLFNETQRLLKETEQRNSELAVINSIQQGLAEKLNFLDIVNLVGDKLREVFQTRDLTISWHDEESDLSHSLYIYEHGKRLTQPPVPPRPGGIIRTRKRVIWNTEAEGDTLAGLPIPGTDSSKSGVGIPIISGDRCLGVIQVENYEREYAYKEPEIRLLTTIAGSLGAALQNAHLFDETQRLLKETEQRAAELAVINSVQAALAAELNIQGIYDTVGDKIREIFHNSDVDMRIFDPTNDLQYFVYGYENGVRISVEPAPLLKTGISAHITRTRQTLVINENMAQEIEKLGSYLIPGTQMEKSAVYVPLLVGDQARGLISLTNMEREHAFSDSDIRLLQTLANSMSVALENARLFDETQRLLKETEQRAAELAVINSVQAALAAELNIQGIYDTVGDKIREIFHNSDLGIRIYDPTTNLEHFVFSYENGVRLSLKPDPLPKTGISAHVIRTHETLVINEDMAQAVEKLGSYTMPGTQMEKSAVYVPLVVGDQARGLIYLTNMEREHAFSDSDVRLLQTLANSMSIALENARLFDETQRLLNETEKRAADLATVNTLAQALASATELEALIQLTGEQMVNTFRADIVYVALLDSQTKMINFPYIHGEQVDSIPFGEGLTSRIIQTGQPLLINKELNNQRNSLGVTQIGRDALSYLGVPIISGKQAIGVISVESTQEEDRFTEDDVHLLTTLASNVGVAIEKARLYEETQRRAREAAAIAEVGREISSTLDLPTVLERIATRACDLLKGDDSAVYLPDKDGKSFRAIAAVGQDANQIIQDIVLLGEGIIGDTARRAVAELLVDTSQDPRSRQITGTTPSKVAERMMVAPLLAGERVTGMMAVWREGGEEFKQIELEFLIALSRQAAIAIQNARLFTEVQNQKKFSEALIQISPVAIVIHDKSNQVSSWNPAAEKLFGYSQEEALGNEINSLIATNPDLREDAIEYSLHVAQGDNFHSVTWRNCKDGRLVDVEVLTVPVILEENRLGTFAVYHDITELKEAEAAIQESERRLADIIDFLPDATLVINNEGKVIAWNRAIEEMTGVKARDMLGKGDYEYALPFYGERRPILIDLVLMPRDEFEAKYAQIQRVGKTLIGESFTPELKEGVYMYAAASALHDSKGNVVGAIETIRDITERKQAEVELQKAKESADAANASKSAFLAMMSHEIRTPMNAVIGMSGILMDTKLTNEQREYAEIIRTSGDALLSIINDILDFSKIEAGKMDLESQPFDLREVVESALDLIAPKAVEKGLDIAYVFENRVPPAILGDVTRLRQILINLLGNAVKFTEKGEVVLNVSGMAESQNAGQPDTVTLKFIVRDTGIGIPPDRMGLLFQSFSQADSSTTRKYGGTGLGLAISKRLTGMMGGNLWAESTGVPGEGSSFIFTIQTEAVVMPKGAHREIEGVQSYLNERRVLIVDDNATNRRILTLQLHAWGMQTRDSESPDQALQWIKRGDPFDLAILDMHMPGMDGVTLAGKIRGLRDAKELPLVLFSSLGRRETQAGSDLFAAFLNKPIKPSQLFDTLAVVFSEQPAGERQAAPQKMQMNPEIAKQHPLRILLAEDLLVNQKLALRLLEQMGYRADVASNGIEAVESVARQDYDVVLMDVQMPEMDGLEASRRICARLPRGQRPTIIAMTANAMQGDREMCLAAGMDDYVSKPIRKEELINALLKVTPIRQR